MPPETAALLQFPEGDVQSYLDARDALIQAEQARRLDAAAVQQASGLEQEANRILLERRASEWAVLAQAHTADVGRSNSITSPPGLSHPRRHLVQKTGDTAEVEQQNDAMTSPLVSPALDQAGLSKRNSGSITEKALVHDDDYHQEFHLFGQSRVDEVYRGMGVFQAMRTGLLSEKSDLYRLFQSLPKGGDLHCHFEGSVDVQLYLHFAATTPQLHIRSDRPLHTAPQLYQARIEFEVIHPAKFNSPEYALAPCSIWSESYVPNSWALVATARDAFPHPDTYEAPAITSRFRSLGRLQHTPKRGQNSSSQHAFDTWLHSRLTMTPHAFVTERCTSVSAWAHFSATFFVIRGLISYEPNFKASAKRVMWDHILDGVPYLEVRANFLPKFILAQDMKTELPHTEWCRIWLEAEAEVRRELAQLNQTRPAENQLCFHAAKLIFTSLRFIDGPTLRANMEDCLKCKQAYPDLIVGFDLVGHEDPGVTLREYLPDLLWFTEQVKQQGWWDPSRPDLFDALGERSLPFLFHAGETLESGGPADNNLYDALLLGTRRIGHGFSLHKHPLLMDLVKQKNVMIECCPISNEILRFTDTLAAHPLVDYIAQGVPLALASDDCTQFGNKGLTPDLFFTFMSLENVSLITIRELTRQSILHARMKPDVKATFLAHLDARWEGFWRSVVSMAKP